MKLGLIRCLQTEDMCPATTDLKFIKARKGAFEGITEDIELIGITTCGGCPGKKAMTRAVEMVERGADTIVQSKLHVKERHRLLQCFFNEILGVDPQIANRDACSIEHYISPATMEKLVDFLDSLTD